MNSAVFDRGRTASITDVAIGVVGTCTAVVAGSDGSPPWQLVRAAALTALTLAVLHRVRRVGRPASAWTSVVTGSAGIVVGLGIGLPHATRTGVSVQTVAGIAALAAGALLTLTGTSALVRRLPRWWRLLALPAAAAITVFALFPLTFALTVTNTPGTAVEDERPSDHGIDYRDVEFTTDDGVDLSGWYIPSTNRAAVVLMHGSGSTRSAVLDHAIVLAERGYGVLLFDSRGNGDSDGRAMGLGWYGDLDTAAAVSFLSATARCRPGSSGRRRHVHGR